MNSKIVYILVALVVSPALSKTTEDVAAVTVKEPIGTRLIPNYTTVSKINVFCVRFEIYCEIFFQLNFWYKKKAQYAGLLFRCSND